VRRNPLQHDCGGCLLGHLVRQVHGLPGVNEHLLGVAATGEVPCDAVAYHEFPRVRAGRCHLACTFQRWNERVSIAYPARPER
jgi:hypothetical protein